MKGRPALRFSALPARLDAGLAYGHQSQELLYGLPPQHRHPLRRTPGAGSPPPPASPTFPSGGPVQPHITASCAQWPVAPVTLTAGWPPPGQRSARASRASHPSRQLVRHSLGGLGGPATSLWSFDLARAVGGAGRPLRGLPPPVALRPAMNTGGPFQMAVRFYPAQLARAFPVTQPDRETMSLCFQVFFTCRPRGPSSRPHPPACHQGAKRRCPLKTTPACRPDERASIRVKGERTDWAAR